MKWFDSAPGHHINTVVARLRCFLLCLYKLLLFACVKIIYALRTLATRCLTLLMTLAKHLRLLTAHYTSNPNILYLRDGEVVLYRRSSSPLYQCRFKLADGS